MFQTDTATETEHTLQEHHKFLTKTEISLISDKSFTMEVYGNFRFSMVETLLVTLQINFLH